MEIRNLITFTKVAEAGSLSKAARLLGYAQSTVTMQMQQLEQELGVPLYERVGKQIRITQAGQELLSYAVQIIKMSEEALLVGREAPKAIDGSLRLGVLEVLAGEELAGRADAYLSAHPQVDLEIRTETDGGTLLDLLRHNEVDFVITLDHLMTDADLVHAEDRAEGIHFFIPGNHPLAGSGKLELEQILQYPLIRGAGSLPYEQELDRYIGQTAVRQTMVKHQGLALKMAAGQGSRERLAGVAVAPDGAAREYVENGRLKALDCEIPGCQMWQQTIYHKNKWLTGAMNAWIAMAEDRR